MTCNCGPTTSPGVQTDFQYAVKIVCGQIPATKPTPLPPGRYFTVTNVHNPSRCDTITLRWKVAFGSLAPRPEQLPAAPPPPATTPEGRAPRTGDVAAPIAAPPATVDLLGEVAAARRAGAGAVSGFVEAQLGPDEALVIDCNDVKVRLQQSGIALPPYVEGWVVIETAAALDVVAVYASSSTAEDAPRTFHTERVEPRCLPICGDFELDISTGVSAWEVRAPGATEFEPATLRDLGWPKLPGSLWVVPGNVQVAGDYTYRLRFKLCSGFVAPALELQLLADNAANVFVNGHPIAPSTPGSGYSSPASYATGAFFQAGDNELTVVVRNNEGPTGLALHGSLAVERGLCPGAAMPLLACPHLCYAVYTRHFFWQRDGGWWTGDGCDGAEVGTTGEHRRVEAFRAHLTGPVPPGTTIEYRAHMQGTGWTNWMPEGSECGVTGQHKRLEAIELRLVNAPLCCRLHYAVYTRKDLFSSGGGGWRPWVTDGQTAGTTGENRRVEAMRAYISCD